MYALSMSKSDTSEPFLIDVIEYAKLGMQVTGIDIDDEAIKIANEIILSNNITNANFECRDADDVNYENYDVIVIAAMIENKDKIISKIRSKTDKPILARCPINERAKMFYSPCKNQPIATVEYTNSILKGHIF